jgi:hypothetical protein
MQKQQNIRTNNPMTNHTIHFLSGHHVTGPILMNAVQGSGAGVGALVLWVKSAVVVLVAVVVVIVVVVVSSKIR